MISRQSKPGEIIILEEEVSIIIIETKPGCKDIP